MKNKRVLIFEAYPFFSGAQKISLTLCKVLKNNNYHITLLLADGSDNTLREKYAPYVDNIFVIDTSKELTNYGNAERWFKLSVIWRALFKGLFPFYKQCFKILKNNEFDYLYYCDPRGAVMMYFIRMFFKGKRICYLQGKNKLSKFLARIVYFTLNDVVLCPSTDVLESLPPSPKKRILYYGVELAQYKNVESLQVADEIVNLVSANSLNRTKLLYAGLIKPPKGLHNLIYSMKALKDRVGADAMPVLFILGNPKSEPEKNYQDNLKKYCDQNGISEFVYWLGWKNNVLEWMINSDYFLFTTVDKEYCNFEGFDNLIESTEGSPVVLIESSLCNLFSISSKVTGVNETISDYHNGLMYDPNVPEALTNILAQVLSEKLKFVDFPHKERFSIENFSTNVLEIFS